MKFLLAALYGILLAVVGVNAVVKYSCNVIADGQGGFTNQLVLEEFDTNTFVKIIVKDQGLVPACTDADKANGLKLTITPGVDCGTQPDPGTKQFQIKIISFENGLIQDKTDVESTIQCDFDKPSTQQLIAPSVNIAQVAFATGNPEAAQEVLAFSLLNPNNNDNAFPDDGTPAKAIPVNFGSDVKIGITLTKSEFAKAAKVKECTAESDDAVVASRVIVDLIQNYCSDDANGIFDDKTKGFDGSTITINDQLSKSPTFSMFTLQNKNAVIIFKCTVEFCTSDDADNDCTGTNQCTKNTGKRRRRSAENYRNTTTISTTVIITPPGTSSSRATATKVPALDTDSCMQSPAFIALVSVLAVVVLVSVAAMVYLYSRTSRSRSQSNENLKNPNF